ncbi:GcrA family cell cycle regulator [Roseibium porphyridii]|uniref:GcrA family cell cycle regulator n=1 Tax=Roseibium porphyridii TaxID=2866279 RepID=A0ABY8F093_9HYPH|nr:MULTISPECIES: GcrA family cell cycle regulator [Stappiaceae]QFT33484.1 GcrA cell cycle regulator [Labrenzia sp. THAF82]WFE88754.1 GcrA family cell cycle regulator [Roseibium sp. KMA01]
MSWTDERVELLKKLWSDGLSASQIAGELGGVTRNAVIGKVHRLGLSGRAKSSSSSSKPRRPRTNAPATGTSAPKKPTPQPQTIGATALKADIAPTPIVEAEPDLEPIAELVPISERASILTLTERTCKWPIGDPATDDFYFCGRQSDAGVPYCAHHCKIAYQPVADRRRDRKVIARAG